MLLLILGVSIFAFFRRKKFYRESVAFLFFRFLSIQSERAIGLLSFISNSVWWKSSIVMKPDRYASYILFRFSSLLLLSIKLPYQ